jgi:hypothetical protein
VRIGDDGIQRGTQLHSIVDARRDQKDSGGFKPNVIRPDIDHRLNVPTDAGDMRPATGLFRKCEPGPVAVSSRSRIYMQMHG